MNQEHVTKELEKYGFFGDNSENFERIFDTCHIPQRSEKWFQLRKITASKIYECVDKKSFAKFVIEQSSKKKTFVLNQYIHIGKNMEDLSQFFYSCFFKAHVLPMSIVKHNKFDFIGASPDGFSIRKIDGDYGFRLLEIKCPTKRQIKSSGNNIFSVCTYPYTLQCWLQLECCQIQINDLWQNRILVFNTEEEMLKFDFESVKVTFNTGKDYSNFQTLTAKDLHEGGYTGDFRGQAVKLYPIQYDQNFDIEFQTILVYPDTVNMSYIQIQEWVKKFIADVQQKDNKYFKDGLEYRLIQDKCIVFWRFEFGHLCEVHQSPGWFYNNISTITTAWECIQTLKQDQETWEKLNNQLQKYVSNQRIDRAKSKIFFELFMEDYNSLVKKI